MPGRAHAEPTSDRERAHLLEVYAMCGCPGWRRATDLATLARTTGIAGVQVRIVDLSHPGTVVPESVVASPTWLLDGHRIALGNPDADWLLARLDALRRDH